MTFTPIPENSAATPGLWNSRFQDLQSQITATGSWFSSAYSVAAGYLNVVDFGADPTNTSDSWAAIEAADLAASSGVYSNTAGLFFPPGNYRVNQTLTYRGVPWRGAGPSASVLDCRSSTTGVNAVGSTTTRPVMEITGMGFSGANSGNSAIGLALGWNQRSMRAMDNVLVANFGSDGIAFADQNWIMDFRGVRLINCGNRKTGGGAGLSALTSATNLLGLNFIDCCIESCGTLGSGNGGGVHFRAQTLLDGINFIGGTFEDNFGAAEIKIVGGRGISFHGSYFEGTSSSVASDGLVFDGCSVGLFGTFHTGSSDNTMKAVRFLNGCVAGVYGSRMEPNYKGGAISVEGTSRVIASGLSRSNGTISVASTAQFVNFGDEAYGLNLGQQRLISVRTLAASALTVSAASTNLRADEVVFTIGGASGASLAIHSGGTVYIFNSALSAKVT